MLKVKQKWMILVFSQKSIDGNTDNKRHPGKASDESEDSIGWSSVCSSVSMAVALAPFFGLFLSLLGNDAYK